MGVNTNPVFGGTAANILSGTQNFNTQTPQMNYANVGGGGNPMSAFGNFWNNNGQGIMGGLGAATGLMNLYSGFKALGMQEDQFDFQKEAWTKNYNNQVKDYENRIKDRWESKSNAAASRGKEYASLESYVADRKLDGGGG